jgi:hypothetical protein
MRYLSQRDSLQWPKVWKLNRHFYVIDYFPDRDTLDGTYFINNVSIPIRNIPGLYPAINQNKKLSLTWITHRCTSQRLSLKRYHPYQSGSLVIWPNPRIWYRLISFASAISSNRLRAKNLSLWMTQFLGSEANLTSFRDPSLRRCLTTNRFDCRLVSINKIYIFRALNNGLFSFVISFQENAMPIKLLHTLLYSECGKSCRAMIFSIGRRSSDVDWLI